MSRLSKFSVRKRLLIKPPLLKKHLDMLLVIICHQMQVFFQLLAHLSVFELLPEPLIPDLVQLNLLLLNYLLFLSLLLLLLIFLFLLSQILLTALDFFLTSISVIKEVVISHFFRWRDNAIFVITVIRLQLLLNLTLFEYFRALLRCDFVFYYVADSFSIQVRQVIH